MNRRHEELIKKCGRFMRRDRVGTSQFLVDSSDDAQTNDVLEGWHERLAKGMFAFVGILCFLAGCAAHRDQSPDTLMKLAASERRCDPPQVSQATTGRAIVRDAVDRTMSKILNEATLLEPSGFSPQALDIAETIGARNLVAQLPRLTEEDARNAEGAAVRLLRVRQQLSDRIVMAILEVARTAAEVDCEEERADQLADRLQEVRDQKIRYRTLIAIVGDAAVGILAGAFGLALQETAVAASDIFGGTIATVFGVAAAFTGGEHEFRHSRNLLKEVWEGPDQSALMPASVWRFLNRPFADDPEGRSFRETLISRWYEDGRLGTPGSDEEQQRIALLFGSGGTYEIEDLRARASMLDLLEADVNLMNEHLHLLMEEVMKHELAHDPAS
ncbi:MAG: hypothetical protein P0111_08080 [Nitrospira sp.]|nr:hypothetical protein [Nitrospira sp.]